MKSYRMSIVSGITALGLALNFASCKTPRQNEASPGFHNSGKPMVVFLNCTIRYDSVYQEYDIDLIDKIITEGTVKQTGDEAGDLKYSLLDKNKQVISDAYIENPLVKTIEYVDENGQLGKKTMTLDSAHFSLRIPLTVDSEYVRFEKDEKQLLLLDLNEE